MISENKFEYKTDVTTEGEISISPYVQTNYDDPIGLFLLVPKINFY